MWLHGRPQPCSNTEASQPGLHETKKKTTNPAKKYHEQWNSKDILRVSLCAFLKTISKLFYVNGFAPLKKNKTTGRVKEIDYFMSAMKDFVTTNCSRILMYEGAPGYGKSHLLMEIEYLASQHENHRLVCLEIMFLVTLEILAPLKESPLFWCLLLLITRLRQTRGLELLTLVTD